MATKKKTSAKKGVKSTQRLLTLLEVRGIKNRFHAQLNALDKLAEKNISAHTKADLKKFKAALKKQQPMLTRF